MMADATYVERIQASAEDVWQFIYWPNLELMIPSGFVDRVEYDEQRPVLGATRRVWFKDGRSVRERLEALPEHASDYAFDYRIIDTGDFPIAEYCGSVRVTPASEKACSVRFSACFTPIGISVEEWREMYLGMQKEQVAFIRSQVEKR